MEPLSVFLLILASSRAIFAFFRRLGLLGLLLLSILDSSFLFLPFGNDLLLIALVSSKSRAWNWFAYVIVSAIGSVVGVFLLDLLMRKTGEQGLERFVSKQKLDRLRDRMSTKAGLTIFLATILPPPFPFTPVVMTASALQVSRQKLFSIVFAGRLIRFTFEAMLALYFGRRVIDYLNSDYVVYAVYGLIAVAVVGSVFSLLRWFHSESR
jgi:membrane protein YqaA with SNARE-associated domain